MPFSRPTVFPLLFLLLLSASQSKFHFPLLSLLSGDSNGDSKTRSEIPGMVVSDLQRFNTEVYFNSVNSAIAISLILRYLPYERYTYNLGQVISRSDYAIVCVFCQRSIKGEEIVLFILSGKYIVIALVDQCILSQPWKEDVRMPCFYTGTAAYTGVIMLLYVAMMLILTNLRSEIQPALDNGVVEAHIGKGICLQMQNMGKQSFESFSEAVKLDPENPCALTHCGILYKDEGRLVEASESYRKALAADPSYKPAAECLAIVLTEYWN
ncbi:putative protein O-GlcNAc transferase [Helianthus annuus]|nr:putative protein O-GlcNAc transferase [Helianthus annuus]